MSGLGSILGGALQGIGGGMEGAEKEKIVARRDAALAKMRMDEQKTGSDLLGQREADRDAREHSSKSILQGNQQKFAASSGAASAAAQERQRQEKRSWDIEDQKAEEARQMRLERFKSNARIKEIMAEGERDGNQVTDTILDEKTGAVSVIRKNGTGEIVNGVIGRKLPRASSSGDSLFGGEDTVSPVKAAQPAAKIISRADLMTKAEQAGIDESAAQAWAKRNGYTVK